MSSRITRKHPSIILTQLTVILASAIFFERILLINLACICVLFRPKPTEDVGCKENREAYGADEMTAKLPDADTLLGAQRAAAENAARMATPPVTKPCPQPGTARPLGQPGPAEAFCECADRLYGASFRSLSGEYATVRQPRYKGDARWPVHGERDGGCTRSSRPSLPIWKQRKWAGATV
jgi:hypothetical protein